MAIDTSKPLAPTIISFYEGVAEAERIVWERFLRSPQNDLDGVLYNVAVGEAFIAPAGTAPGLTRMWEMINKSRIDALGIRGDQLIAFEIKVSAGLGAIGQAISGKLLAAREDDFRRSYAAAIVSDAIRPDARYVAGQLDIALFIFPPA